ncbi:hypothetical protein U1Q18_020580 [Sarracenia purpurea var. burkii]
MSSVSRSPNRSLQLPPMLSLILPRSSKSVADLHFSENSSEERPNVGQSRRRTPGVQDSLFLCWLLTDFIVALESHFIFLDDVNRSHTIKYSKNWSSTGFPRGYLKQWEFWQKHSGLSVSLTVRGEFLLRDVSWIRSPMNSRSARGPSGS